jgi:hypothetical protein
MHLLLLAVAVGPPIWAFLLAVLVLFLITRRPMRWVVRNRKILAVRLFRLTSWAWPLQFATVAGGLPGTAIGITMNVGYPGTYSRNGDNITNGRQVTPTDTVGPLFGDAVFLIGNATGGTFSSIEAVMIGGTYTPTMTEGTSSSSAVFAGIAVREVLTNATSYLSQNAVTAYVPGNICDVLVRGSIVVQTSNPKSAALPIAGGAVYLRISTNGAGTAVGAFEYAADGGHTLQLTNCWWTTGVVDANGAAEITIQTRNTP